MWLQKCCAAKLSHKWCWHMNRLYYLHVVLLLWRKWSEARSLLSFLVFSIFMKTHFRVCQRHVSYVYDVSAVTVCICVLGILAIRTIKIIYMMYQDVYVVMQHTKRMHALPFYLKTQRSNSKNQISVRSDSGKPEILCFSFGQKLSVISVTPGNF